MRPSPGGGYRNGPDPMRGVSGGPFPGFHSLYSASIARTISARAPAP
jgi:hypothetical protein